MNRCEWVYRVVADFLASKAPEGATFDAEAFRRESPFSVPVDLVTIPAGNAGGVAGALWGSSGAAAAEMMLSVGLADEQKTSS